MLFNKIKQTVSALDTKSIVDDRKIVLQKLVDYIQEKVHQDKSIQLNFICTHNSRRSQLGQVWAKAMGHFYEIPVDAFSGGTEVTACHANTIQILEESGFQIKKKTSGDNPQHECKYADNANPIELFSKLYDDVSNPESDFAAIMTCGHAEENCPFVAGCEKRIAITYEDPKVFDNTDLQEAMYLERSLQIATEMKYVFKQIQK